MSSYLTKRECRSSRNTGSQKQSLVYREKINRQIMGVVFLYFAECVPVYLWRNCCLLAFCCAILPLLWYAIYYCFICFTISLQTFLIILHLRSGLCLEPVRIFSKICPNRIWKPGKFITKKMFYRGVELVEQRVCYGNKSLYHFFFRDGDATDVPVFTG
jgi:hypothetical protein